MREEKEESGQDLVLVSTTGRAFRVIYDTVRDILSLHDVKLL